MGGANCVLGFSVLSCPDLAKAFVYGLKSKVWGLNSFETDRKRRGLRRGAGEFCRLRDEY